MRIGELDGTPYHAGPHSEDSSVLVDEFGRLSATAPAEITYPETPASDRLARLIHREDAPGSWLSPQRDLPEHAVWMQNLLISGQLSVGRPKSVSRDSVVAVYLDVLGRYPESEEVVEAHCRNYRDAVELRRGLRASAEFRLRHYGHI